MMRIRIAPLVGALALAAIAGVVSAEPLQPRGDDDVVEVLPASGVRAEERTLRRRLAANPTDATAAVVLARRYVEAARAQGDPRYAGRALALLGAWPDSDAAPSAVLLMRATVRQHLHDFDGAAAVLEQLVLRDPQDAQAWLTLATVRRVQGRYAQSDAACDALERIGATLHGRACRAENDGLRGRTDTAGASLRSLVGSTGDRATQAWLLTTLAELDARAARPAAAEDAYRAALASGADRYTTLSYVDFLLGEARCDDALALLRELPRSDDVLLRLAIARQTPASSDARELRERFDQAALRGDAGATHLRERAMFALWVDGDAVRAVELARRNLRHQREPRDLLLLAQAARTAGDREARLQAATIAKEIGLHDTRLEVPL